MILTQELCSYYSTAFYIDDECDEPMG